MKSKCVIKGTISYVSTTNKVGGIAMKSFQIYAGFITLLYMLMSANSMFADTVNMEFKEENSINWYNPEKYKDYAEIDDKYNIFNFSKYITEWQPEVKDYRVMIGNDPNYIQVLYKINSYFAVEKKMTLQINRYTWQSLKI